MKAIEELRTMPSMVPPVSIAATCRSVGVPRATLYRRRQPKLPKAATTPRPKPPRALSEPERQQVLDVLHS